MGSAVAAQSGTGIALTALVDRACKALASARGAAQVLEARDMASMAVSISQKAARLLKAKRASEKLISAAYRAQADALEIEAQAKRRLADEYDAAQPDGPQFHGNQWSVPDENAPLSAKSAGLSRKEIHEARIIRDAEQAEPGIVRRTLDAAIEAGEEPSRAKVNRAVLGAARPDRFEGIPESTPNSRFLNVAWDAEHRPSEFDFPAMTNFGALAAAAERVSQSWSTAAAELRRLEGK